MAEEQQPKYARTQYSHESVHGERVQEDLFVGDDYVQAGDRIRSMDPARKDRFLEHVTGALPVPAVAWLRCMSPSPDWLTFDVGVCMCARMPAWRSPTLNSLQRCSLLRNPGSCWRLIARTESFLMVVHGALSGCRYSPLNEPLSIARAGWLVEPKMTNEVRDAWMDIWDKCDGSFGSMVRAEIEKAAPSGKREMATSKA